MDKVRQDVSLKNKKRKQMVVDKMLILGGGYNDIKQVQQKNNIGINAIGKLYSNYKNTQIFVNSLSILLILIYLSRKESKRK